MADVRDDDTDDLSARTSADIAELGSSLPHANGRGASDGRVTSQRKRRSFHTHAGRGCHSLERGSAMRLIGHLHWNESTSTLLLLEPVDGLP